MAGPNFLWVAHAFQKKSTREIKTPKHEIAKRCLRAHNELAYVAESGDLRRIDRLVEFDDAVWVLDYKTGDAVDPENLAAAARPY